jgi:3-hydroxy-9,10-secoandrosta-1,3,5(10)-triene-9,17-dione monooxygenase
MTQASAVHRSELLEGARNLVPTLRSRAAEAERLRRMPDKTIADFRAAKFYQALQPARYGGLELPFGVHTEFSAELARGCASSAWHAVVVACHAWVGGMFPPDAQEELWADDPTTLIATSFRPDRISVEREGEGLRISGRWKFSSGVDVCSWAMLTLGVPPESGAGRSEPCLALVPLSACVVEDTWFASGLAATGSNDIVIQDHVVPPHRLVAFEELRGGPSPGSAVNPGYLYRLPIYGMFSFNLIGCAIGTARGAVEALIERIRDRESVTGAQIGALPSAQLRVAEAQAEVDAATALMLRNLDEIHRNGEAGEVQNLDDRVRYRRDNAFAAQLSTRAVDRIYPLLGGAGLASDDPIQRAWRDVHAIAQHIALIWDLQGGVWGAVALGQPCPDPRI